jgi:subtilisin family serine protease
VLALAASVAAAPAAAAPPAAGELLVGVSASSGAAGAAAASGRTIAPGVRVVRGGSAAAARLRRTRGVRWVEPNRTFRAASIPNDPLLDQQWPLTQPDATGVQEAWRTSVGGAVTVAVLDTGVDSAHPDLAPNMWHDPAAGASGVDVTGGGGPPTDDNGHGTAVAGIIAARGDNGIGGTGVAQDARIMAVRVLGADAVGTTATVVEGMRYALAHGARIINLSLSGPDRSQALEEQIQAAQAQGVLVVAAAGNQGADLGTRPSYPAAYPEPNVIAVASTGPNGVLSSFSDRGAGAVDLAAPGEDVLGPSPGGSYARWSGTSAAAPEVAGAAVLLEAASPGAGANQVRDALLGGARRLPGLSGAVAAGELDAGAAMRRLVPNAGAARPQVRLAARRSQIRAGRDVGRLTLRWSVAGDRGAVAGYRLELLGHRPVVRSAGRRAARATSWTLGLPPGRWSWRLVALDRQGHALAQLRGRARVPQHHR